MLKLHWLTQSHEDKANSVDQPWTKKLGNLTEDLLLSETPEPTTELKFEEMEDSTTALYVVSSFSDIQTMVLVDDDISDLLVPQ